MSSFSRFCAAISWSSSRMSMEAREPWGKEFILVKGTGQGGPRAGLEMDFPGEQEGRRGLLWGNLSTHGCIPKLYTTALQSISCTACVYCTGIKGKVKTLWVQASEPLCNLYTVFLLWENIVSKITATHSNKEHNRRTKGGNFSIKAHLIYADADRGSLFTQLSYLQSLNRN